MNDKILTILLGTVIGVFTIVSVIVAISVAPVKMRFWEKNKGHNRQNVALNKIDTSHIGL